MTPPRLQPSGSTDSSATSTPPSETNTLLASDVLMSPRSADDADRPVQLDGFKKNVQRCKVLLGLGLPATLALEVLHFIFALKDEGLGNQRQMRTLAAIVWTDCTGVIMTTILSLLYLSTLIYPIRIQAISLSPQLPNSRLHRALCTTVFCGLAALLVLHAAPGIVYTVLTHHAPPSLTFAHSTAVHHIRTAVLLCTLVAAGCMRRGPKLYFRPPKLGTGFGVSQEKDESSSAVKIKITSADDDEEAVPITATSDSYDEEDDEASDYRENSNVFDYANSSMLDFVFLSYSAGLARRSMTVPSLAQADLPLLEARTRNSGIRESVFSAENVQNPIFSSQKVTSWMLVKALWYGRGRIVLISFILETTKNVISFLQVIALYEIINNFGENKDGDRSYAYLLCWGLFAGQAIEVLMAAYCGVRENYMLHIPVKMTLASMLYSKILRTTDAKAMEAHNVADADKDTRNRGRSQVMNLLTIDSGTIGSMAIQTWGAANGVVTLIIGTGMLYSMLGVSAFVGIACIPLFAPLSYVVSKFIYRCDKEWARARDARTGALKEFLLGIKVIKLNAFEPYYLSRVSRLRENEVMWQRWRYTLGTAFNIISDQVPLIAMLITFAFHTKVMGRPLEPATGFVALRVFYRIKDGLQTFPRIIQDFLNCKVALGRISTFLSQPELEKERYDSASRTISCENATIGWPRADPGKTNSAPTFKLQDINLTIPEGRLTLVCGPLGSGKTLLLRAFLGEARIESGTVLAPRSLPDATPVYPEDDRRTWSTAEWLTDSVAYAPQQSFIRHGTIRDNILFGQPMWRERYRKVLRQAALLPDLDIMVDGDLTEVGEHGITLSGGQKARVGLARCLYSRAKTIYLDDILSAVDAHTAQFLYDECLRGSLLRNRTVVLVSHHVSLIVPAAEYVIALRNGRVEQACPADQAKLSALDAVPDPMSPGVEEPLSPMVPKKAAYEERNDANQNARRLYKAEHRAVGRVATNHYMLILRSAGGIWYWLVMCSLLGGFRLLEILRQWWMALWSADPDPAHLNYYLGIWAGITTVAVLIGGMSWVWLYGVNNVGFYSAGSKKIHNMLLGAVFGARLDFFERTPQGRLLNIFGQDIWRLDSQSADSFGRTVMQGLGVVSGVVIVCYKVPTMAIVVLGFGLPLWWIGGHLNKLRSDIRRLTATASSPLYSLYNETIDGVVIVRAFGQNRLLMSAMKVLNNRERVTWLADWTVYNWVSAVVQTITSVIVTATGFTLVGVDISSSEAGFILSYALACSSGASIAAIAQAMLTFHQQRTVLVDGEVQRS